MINRHLISLAIALAGAGAAAAADASAVPIDLSPVKRRPTELKGTSPNPFRQTKAQKKAMKRELRKLRNESQDPP